MKKALTALSALILTAAAVSPLATAGIAILCGGRPG